MADPGVINTGTNPLHWTKLKGVPESIADGSDFPVLLGLGLKKGGFGQGLGLDFEEISKNTGPSVFAGFKDSLGEICNDFCTEGFMNVPAGVISLMGVHSFDGTGYIGVNCRGGSGFGSDLKITAIKLGSLTNGVLDEF